VTTRRGIQDLRLHALHCLARVALRVRPPLQAKEWVDRAGGHLPSLRGVGGARAAVEALFPWGSCLTRAVTIAALLPGAEVVIGMDRWNSARATAHAWLEISGVRVDTDPTENSYFPDEVARLPPALRRAPVSKTRGRPLTNSAIEESAS
jgi:hypothetical protein